jgi:hypothetical protein
MPPKQGTEGPVLLKADHAESAYPSMEVKKAPYLLKISIIGEA